MKPINAVRLWNSAHHRTYGVLGDSEVVDELTSLGGAAVGSDLPTYLNGIANPRRPLTGDKPQYDAVAEFLEKWGAAIRAAGEGRKE